MRALRAIQIAAAAGAALLLGACGGEGGEGGDSAQAPGAPAWLADEAPANAMNVATAKVSATEGDRVTVRGRIGGRSDALSAEAPVFVMVDPAISSCAENPEDGCATPWDYCCETPDTIAANSATVQVLGAVDAAALRQAGLKELDEVIVEGVVGPRPSEDVLVIQADRLTRVGG